MKKVLTTFLLFLLFTSAIAQTKRALIVAIGNYRYWPSLNSINDVAYIKKTLGKQGFKKENITTITDQHATHTGITNALKDLIREAKTGDIVVIHFSSHGEQIEDNNHDETDGLDETIVTYNAVLPDVSGHFKDFQKAQEEYFRDDEFGFFIDQLRNKLGKNGDVIVFMDLCHSGTGTRGNSSVRGGKPPGISLTFDPKKYVHADTAVFREKVAVSGDENAMATYVVFSAAQAGDLAYEIINNDNKKNVRMGSLTYAISKVFENLEPGTTYRSLFSKVQSILDEKIQNQHAVLEGNGIDRELFGGKSVYQKPYVEIENLNGKEIRLSAGLLSGLDTGAIVSVYPSGTFDTGTAKSLATGKVIEANNYTATVELDRDPGLQQAVLGWVFVTTPVYNTRPISVRIETGKKTGLPEGFSESEMMNIREGLKDLPLITFDGENDLIIVKGIERDSIKVVSNGYLFETVNKTGSSIEKLKDALQRYAQYKFLQSIQVKDPGIHIEIKLVPVINGSADTTRMDAKIVHGTYEFSVGDTIMVWVKNTGTHPFYFNIVDMQPDGIMNPVFPQ